MKIKDLITVYLKHLRVIGRTDRTLETTRFDLLSWLKFLKEYDVHHIEDITSEIMEEYQQDLAFRLTAKGLPLAIATQSRLLVIVKGFTRFLKEQDYLINDPSEKIKLPKERKHLPKVILTPEEVRKIIKAVDDRSNRGYRNKIVLEILYDTGIRRSEISRRWGKRSVS